MTIKDDDKKSGESPSVNVNGVNFSHDDLFRVVDDFYTQVQNDDLLQVPFRSVHDWPEHIEKLTHFWWIRFGGKPYMFNSYNPVVKHFFAGFNAEFLERWLSLFHKTMEKYLNPEQVEFWKMMSTRMGQGLSVRNELFKKEYERNPRDGDR